MATTIAETVVAVWIAQFSECLQRKDAQGTTSLFLPDSWLRDFLVFQWDMRTLHGHEKISSYLSANLHKSSLFGFRVASDRYFKPSSGVIPGTVTAGFTFSTPIARGRGHLELAHDKSGEWKACIVFLMLDSLNGYEELDAEGDIYHRRLPTWTEVRAMKWKVAEQQPEVLISTSYQY